MSYARLSTECKRLRKRHTSDACLQQSIPLEITFRGALRHWTDGRFRITLSEGQYRWSVRRGTLVTPDPHKTRHAWGGTLKSIAVGFCVFSLGSVLAAWLNLHNVHGLLAFVDNILTGIAAGLMVLLYERWRQRDVEKKLRTIRLMNHHIRNALQIISAASDSFDGTVPPSTVQGAVRRIEWALREVLPGESELTDDAAPPNPETPKKESAA